MNHRRTVFVCLRYYTGIEPEYLPSYCDYTQTTYSPVKDSYLLAKRRPDPEFLDWFVAEFDNITEGRRRKGLAGDIRLIRIDQHYSNYSFLDLASHLGIVHIPYQVLTKSINHPFLSIYIMLIKFAPVRHFQSVIIHSNNVDLITPNVA
jgi:hypothetical protein